MTTVTPATGMPQRLPAAVTQSRPLVIGLDVATGASGVAGEGWTDHVRTTASSTHARLQYQLDGLASFYRNAEYVVIEGAAYSKNNNGADSLAGLRWMVRMDLWRRRIPYVVITPTKRITYATGSTVHKDEHGARLRGTALKGLVRTAVEERYGIRTEGVCRYDEADAYVLLAMGLHHLGHPLAEVPAKNARGLAGCDWTGFDKAVAR
ncbi:hypothetical protein ACIGD1_11455 [Streptomyces sp. NPDC085612]|uniref:hypothetical protein n=1 Tax=Streptomyces sp. NPDC085612 TaxID=3365732 RepID=UPI0037D673C7